jgi:prophage tail gpP-like protein
MARQETDPAGAFDRVRLVVDGLDLPPWVVKQYQVKCSVFEQPAAFSIHMGAPVAPMELAEGFGVRHGATFDLHIESNPGKPGAMDIRYQTGRIDVITLTQAEGAGLQVEGRDLMAALMDSTFLQAQSYKEKSYYDLTRLFMDEVGLQDVQLWTGGDQVAFRKAVTGHRTIQLATPVDATTQLLEQTNANSGGTKKIVYNTLKARVGQNRYQWLKDQYKRAGLFLWANGDGGFFLGTPSAAQKPTFHLTRRAGAPIEQNNILAGGSCRTSTRSRHSKCTVYGRAGSGKKGRGKVKGSFEDPEMLELGITKEVTLEEDCRTNEECEYFARRWLADERRRGFQLEYVVSGHTAPSLLSGGRSRAVFAVDTMVQVTDQQYGIGCDFDGNETEPAVFYCSDVQFDRGDATTTTLTLMRPQDLVFAEELYKDETFSLTKRWRKPQGKTDMLTQEKVRDMENLFEHALAEGRDFNEYDRQRRGY